MSTPRAYTQFPSQADLFYFCTTSSTSEEDINIHYTPPSKSSLKVGILILSHDQHQLFDIAAIDLITMISRSQINKLNATETALEKSVDEIDIRYISESGDGSFPVTSGARLPVTVRDPVQDIVPPEANAPLAKKEYLAAPDSRRRDISGGEKRLHTTPSYPSTKVASERIRLTPFVQNSFENAPQLDVLVVPGTFSTAELTLAASTFVTRQTRIPSRVAVLSIASGISALIQTGILHHKRATGPLSLLSSLRQRYPETSWRDAEWMRHDNIWTSSSAVTAVDMIAAWMREYFWDRRETVECALSAAGIPPLHDH
jgi:putative intracellular protease/amidase